MGTPAECEGGEGGQRHVANVNKRHVHSAYECTNAAQRPLVGPVTGAYSGGKHEGYCAGRCEWERLKKGVEPEHQG